MLVPYVALIIGGTFINTWIYNNTKSVFLVMLYHAFNNFSAQIIIGGAADPMVATLTAVIVWLISAFLINKFGADTLTGLTEKDIAVRLEKKKEIDRKKAEKVRKKEMKNKN